MRPPAQASERSERKPALVIFPHGKKNKETGKFSNDIYLLGADTRGKYFSKKPKLFSENFKNIPNF